MRKTLLAVAACGVALGAAAKLPAPDDAAKAKAAETAAKAAWQAKVDAYQLCRSQDKIAAKYGAHAGKETPKAALPPCADPGPFAYNPPDQTPLETSGAHSPAGTAAGPPSNKPEAAKMATTKK